MIKIALAVLILVHAAIHVMGLVKALSPASLPDLKMSVSLPWGIFWLFAGLVLVLAGLALLGLPLPFWKVAFLGIALSQVAIFFHFRDAWAGTLPNLIVLLAALGPFGRAVFDHRTDGLLEDLATADQAGSVTEIFHATDRDSVHRIESLPAPVARYLRKVAPLGTPEVRRAVLTQSGSFNLDANSSNWKPFQASHQATTRVPGFVWAAEMQMTKGISAFVHDSYIARRGTMAPWLGGFISLGRGSDEGGEVARGELLRFLAEAPWYPTVLRSNLLTWKALDDRRALATLRDGSLSVALTFTFDEEDLVKGVRCEDRPRLVDNKSIPTPWEGSFSDYRLSHGLLVPFRAEVAWILDGQTHSYYRAVIHEHQVTE